MSNDVRMKDAETLSYINLHAILGSLTELCRIDQEASDLLRGKNISIGFSVKDGANATLHFNDGKCTFNDGIDKCDIFLSFKTPEKFNGMIDGTVTPIPSKGLTKIKFMLREFKSLTNILTKYLRASDEDLKNEDFFNKSTRLMLHVIGAATAQIGNHDKIGSFSAGNIVDGAIKLSIKEVDAVYLNASGHRLSFSCDAPERIMSCMEFENIGLARDLFDGKVNAAVCVGKGQIRITGMISQIDNVNRMLDRVSVYLA